MPSVSHACASYAPRAKSWTETRRAPTPAPTSTNFSPSAGPITTTVNYPNSPGTSVRPTVKLDRVLGHIVPDRLKIPGKGVVRALHYFRSALRHARLLR